MTKVISQPSRALTTMGIGQSFALHPKFLAMLMYLSSVTFTGPPNKIM
jgi:hypothetical protein